VKNPAQTPRKRRKRRAWRTLLILIAYAYPAALVALLVSLYGVGESWWATTALLYVPRALLLLPLPFVVLSLWLARERRLLWTQLLALVLVVFPLMGFVLPGFSSRTADAGSMRLLSFNINSGYSGIAAIAEQISSYHPDIVLIQEGGNGEIAGALRARYPHVHASTQFTLASRFPILEATDPDRIPFYSRQRSPRFMRYLIQTPLGVTALYSIHPISPRGALHVHRFRDALHQVRTGAFLEGDAEAQLGGNTGLRALQIAAAADMASDERASVIVAGDTNLPGLSNILRKNLGRYQDAFSASAWGFGYTYPSDRPFLRLDRIMAGPGFRFTSFDVGCRGVSDHLCVVADIQREQ
jgi:endonuclease/exonuclease/phosphatase family metal-dependent hydrolase